MSSGRFAKIAFVMGLLSALAPSAGWPAGEDPVEAARSHLNHILSVLQLQSSATSAGCVSALEEMHTAEDQMRSLANATDEPTASALHANRQSDIAIAQDVLGSDIDNAVAACGPDAKTVCNGRPSGGAKLCAAL